MTADLPPAGDEPVVDLLDRRGRLTRFAIASAAAIGAMVMVGPALYAWVRPDDQVTTGGWRFVVGMTGVVAALAFIITGAVLRWRARRRDEKNRIPPARVVP